MDWISYVLLLGKQRMSTDRLRIPPQKIFRIFGKTIDKGRDPIYNIPKSDHNNGFGKEEHSMRYAAVSENIMMYMGMCRMCMRTLRYALNSETFSAPGK